MVVTNILIMVGIPSFMIRLGTGCFVIISYRELYFFIIKHREDCTTSTQKKNPSEVYLKQVCPLLFKTCPFGRL